MTSQPAADVARAGTEKWHSELLLRKLQGLPDFGFLGSLSLEHRRREVKPGSKHRYDWDIPFNARWPWNSLVGGHLTLKRVTELSQKDHKQRIARYRLLGSVTNLAMFQIILMQQTYSVCQCSILIDTMLTSERFLRVVFGEAPEQAVKHDKPACHWHIESHRSRRIARYSIELSLHSVLLSESEVARWEGPWKDFLLSFPNFAADTSLCCLCPAARSVWKDVMDINGCVMDVPWDSHSLEIKKVTMNCQV